MRRLLAVTDPRTGHRGVVFDKTATQHYAYLLVVFSDGRMDCVLPERLLHSHFLPDTSDAADFWLAKDPLLAAEPERQP